MDEKAKELFEVKCKKCRSDNVNIISLFPSGEIDIYCLDCDNEVVF